MNLFKKARGKIVIFHRKKNSAGEIEPQVEAFDPENESMEEAIVAGDAVVVDLDNAKFSEDAMELGNVQNGAAGPVRGASYRGASYRGASFEGGPGQPVFINGVPSMRPEAQDVGGLCKCLLRV